MSGMNGHYDPHGGHYQEVAESHLSSQVHDHANISSVPAPDSFGSQNANVSSTTGQAPNENNKHTDIPKDQVGWHFVEQYYLNLSRSPSKLHVSQHLVPNYPQVLQLIGTPALLQQAIPICMGCRSREGRGFCRSDGEQFPLNSIAKPRSLF